MGILKRLKEMFSGKPTKNKTKKLATTKPPAKIDPNLKKLSEIAKRQGDRLKLKQPPKSAKATKRGN